MFRSKVEYLRLAEQNVAAAIGWRAIGQRERVAISLRIAAAYVSLAIKSEAWRADNWRRFHAVCGG